MIALDAAEPSLVERWIADGSLPNLARLRAGGAYGRLASTADWLAGSPWPTFYTGTMPAEHGVYDFLQWHAERMALVRPSPDWLPLRPFWRDVADAGHRVIAVDLPMTFPPEPLDGVEISGWATHDLLAPPASYPPTVLEWVQRALGRPPMSPEVYGPQRPGALLRLRDELNRATRGVADLARTLMGREPWDLCMVGFGATHRGGHKLWDLSGVEGDVAPAEQVELSRALRDLYVTCDAAVGALVDAAGAGTTVLVFSLHGMGPNSSRADLLPAMLDRILDPRAHATERPERPSLVKRVLALFPREWRHRVKLWLPSSWQDRLTVFALLGRTDFATARAFSLIADIQGYVRLNLRGRESPGLVAPGEEYDRLCAAIADGLGTFADADTGEPVVASVMRVDRLFADGPRRDRLPDLIVRWADSPAARHRAIASSRHGSIPWPTPGRNPDGRSGEHRPEGFLVATGPGVRPDSRIEPAHIRDLAPTVCALLGVPTPARMCGVTLPGIAS
jgi:predicted AlkP superfamily phosphohydrolase/phosphomutase